MVVEILIVNPPRQLSVDEECVALEDNVAVSLRLTDAVPTHALEQLEYRWRICDEWRRVEPCQWDTLRHTFCSYLAKRGAPAKAIQELAGQSA